MMGLRLREGVSVSKLEEEGGAPVEQLLDLAKFSELAAQGWAHAFARGSNDARLSLTREGMLRLNALVPYLLKAQG
mgnify:FL=1